MNEGEELRLTCHPNVVWTDNRPIKFLWLYNFEKKNNDTPLSENQTYRTIATKYEAGTYKCQAKSQLGDAEDSVDVTVVGAEGDQERQSLNQQTIPMVGFSIAGLIIFIMITAVLVYRRTMSQQMKTHAEDRASKHNINGNFNCNLQTYQSGMG